MTGSPLGPRSTEPASRKRTRVISSAEQLCVAEPIEESVDIMTSDHGIDLVLVDDRPDQLVERPLLGQQLPPSHNLVPTPVTAKYLDELRLRTIVSSPIVRAEMSVGRNRIASP